jgi:hypothetical protein
MVLDKDAEVLNGLGLTTLQAKTYLAIAILEKATVKTISKTAKIARQEIYRITSELQEKGLIEKIIAAPVEYRAIPVHDAINVLLQRTHQENLDARKKAMKLVQRIEETNLIVPHSEDNLQFVLIPKKEAPRRKFANAIHDTSVSFDGIYYWEGLRGAILGGAEIWKKNVEKGIKVRFIVYKPKEEKAVKRVIQTLMERGSFSVKCTSNPPPATIAIFDKEEIFVTTSPTPRPGETSSLLIRNPGFVAVFQAYFDRIWETSEAIQEKQDKHSTSEDV